MGKASRTKRERRVPAAPVVKGAAPAAGRTRLVWAATGAVGIVVAVVVIVLLATRTSTKPPPPAPVSAADRNAPASLVAAADKVEFHPTTEPGVGQIESKPASAAGPPSNPNLLPVGSQAPGFTLRTPEGKRVGLASLRGKAVLLEFFATWCPHCNAEAPHLRQLYASLPKSRYAFVSVNADGEDAASVFAYDRYFGLGFPSLLDPSSHPGNFHSPGAAGPVTQSYHVASYPTFYVLDPRGKVVWASDGEQPDALLRLKLTGAARG